MRTKRTIARCIVYDKKIIVYFVKVYPNDVMCTILDDVYM